MPPRKPPQDAFNTYLRKIQENLASGIATEDTHRSALEQLLESLNPTIRAFNDPQHISVGAPDFTVRRKGNASDFPVGWIETKDVGDSRDLDKAEKSEQLERYFGLPNLILTDYLEFRWFVDGKLRLSTARLATPLKGGRLRRDAEGEQQVLAILNEFLSYSLATLVTPRELAERMAKLAHLIRDVLLRTLQAEPVSGHLHNQFEAFRETLIPDLKPDQFADMYAQTIAYGLFAARCQSNASAQEFGRAAAADLIPRTNPFLRRLFREIAFELDPRVEPFVNDLVALLRHAEIGKIMEDFGKRSAKEDPVVHFYEDFLQEYDPKIREMRGVYYTPEPVVSYIVRSVDHLLKTRFGKPLGLADKDVLILDPACGTGTFLYDVIRRIYAALEERGQTGQWNRYVSDNLLKRIFGFELLMAPYAVAHLKLGLLLQELGYKFESDERLGIFLTNSLEEAIRKSQRIFAEWISQEANAASEIKREKPIMVVLGNPPYSGHSANKGKWISGLMEDYKRDCPELYKPAQAKWLQDDYVKFLRFAQWRIDLTGHGVLAFITNHGYMDNPTFRCMRQRLLTSFPEILLLDLHGSSKKKEISPNGSKDENVFDIQQGVAIGIFLKESANRQHQKVLHAELWGTRESKYRTLTSTSLSDTKWRPVPARQPLYLFVPRDEALYKEYEKGWSVSDIFDRNGDPAPGIVTTQDQLAISFTSEEAKEKVHKLLATETEQEARRIFQLCSQSQWDYKRAKLELGRSDWEKNVVQILYRPFDLRWTVYDSNVAVHRRDRVMKHLLRERNIALVTARSNRSPQSDHFFCSSNIVETKCGESTIQSYTLPLFLHTTHERPQKIIGFGEPSHPKVNLNPAFLKAVSDIAKVPTEESAQSDLGGMVTPIEIFAYIYAVLYSPAYRRRYAQFLKLDFPRIPIISSTRLFRTLIEKGRELTLLHLLMSPRVTEFITRYQQPGDHLIEKVRYIEANTKLGINRSRTYINSKQYFEGVPTEVWGFHIGGYQVCEKWLKDRKGRTLSSDDIDHYQKIVVAISETVRIMHEIDDLIPGWPLP